MAEVKYYFEQMPFLWAYYNGSIVFKLTLRVGYKQESVATLERLLESEWANYKDNLMFSF